MKLFAGQDKAHHGHAWLIFIIFLFCFLHPDYLCIQMNSAVERVWISVNGTGSTGCIMKWCTISCCLLSLCWAKVDEKVVSNTFRNDPFAADTVAVIYSRNEFALISFASNAWFSRGVKLIQSQNLELYSNSSGVSVARMIETHSICNAKCFKGDPLSAKDTSINCEKFECILRANRHWISILRKMKQ